MKKINSIACVAALVAVVAVAASIRAQKKADAHAAQHDAKMQTDCPMMRDEKAQGGDAEEKSADGDAKGHDSHLAAVNERGARAMGFSQTATTHHFLLTREGGLIEVEANDPKDAESRELIRRHLAHIARSFAEGDFDTPMLVHDRVPPGVPIMRRLKSEITYDYEETDKGGLVRIRTKNAEALSAVHDFLRFQITDHKTGDPLEPGDR